VFAFGDSFDVCKVKNRFAYCIFVYLWAFKKMDMFDRNFTSEVDILDWNTTPDAPVAEYPFDNKAAMKMPGGVIVLDLNVHDYSMTQIARIVEDNDAKIWCCYVSIPAGSAKMEVTLKISQTDLTSIIRSFQRYGYSIKASYQGHNRHEDILRNHYDQFMLYLNV